MECLQIKQRTGPLKDEVEVFRGRFASEYGQLEQTMNIRTEILAQEAINKNRMRIYGRIVNVA